MSTQRGNVKKNKPPKHKNKMAFKNSLHDTSKRTKELNDMDISGVCLRCKDILEWKIKYKKYKSLSQPKKCTKCQQKTVKHAYHIICMKCRELEGLCAKCGHSVDEMDDVTGVSGEEAGARSAEMNPDIAPLTERERSFLRKQEQCSSSKGRASLSTPGEHEDDGKGDRGISDDDDDVDDYNGEEHKMNKQVQGDMRPVDEPMDEIS